MTKLKTSGRLALTGALLLAAAGAGRAQLAATLTEISSATPPVPGTYDSAQLLCSAVTGKPGGLNYYWDNGTPNGSTFYTGSNAGGYVLNAVTLKTIGGGGSDGSGGITYSQPYDMYIYSVNGSTATLLAEYQSQSFSFSTEGDWLQMSGMNLPLLPNTQYAYTFTRTLASYENLGFTNGIPATVGRICEIPTTGGTVNFGSATLYSGTFDVGLSQPTALTVAAPVSSVANPITVGAAVTLTAGTVVDNAGNGTYTYQWQTDGGSGGTLTNIPGATGTTLAVNTTGDNLGLYQYQVVVRDSTSASVTSLPLGLDVTAVISGTFTDTGATAPTPGGYDAAQLTTAGTYINAPGLNYYDDNGNPPGQTFSTGANPKGYAMSSVAILMRGGGSSGTTTPQGYDLFLYSISTDGTTATLLADVTNLAGSFTYGDWVQWGFSPVTLNPNSTYAYTFHRRTTGYAGLSTSTGGDVYPGGQVCAIASAGGLVAYSTSGGNDGTFDIGLVPLGVSLILNNPTATPNPVYALSPVVLHDTVQLPTTGSFTYKWLTDDGSGATPPNYITIPGATSTNLTVIPQDLTPGGSPYTTNYYFVASVGSSSATSAPVVLTVNAASMPLLTESASMSNNLVTFAGDSTLDFSVGEAGTVPITNQWQLNSGTGLTNLLGQTSAILALSNLQISATGTYQVTAANVKGNATASVALTVLPAPAPPATSEKYARLVAAANPYAYWRLIETNDPTVAGAPTFSAYDYSGHGLDATYGDLVQVDTPANPLAGPQSPTFPGFSASEGAAETTAGAGGFLNVPPLNLKGQTNLTFMAWINPNSTPAGATGLLFDRLDPNDGANSAYGFGFDNNGNGELGYTWNNNSQATWSWNSEISVANGQWNFVAYVVTPTNVTVYVGNLNNGTTNFFQASNPGANISESWSGTASINLGVDANSITGRAFLGLIAEASLLTNALTTAQVQQFFLTGIGAAALPPSIASVNVIPASEVYSGQNVLLEAVATGTAPLTNTWQISSDSINWTTIPGANGSTLVANPQIVGTVYYQYILSSAAGAATNGPIPVTYDPLPTTPAGLWTVNFQETNNIGAGQTAGGGVGHYVGRGILGNGMYWNVLPHILPLGGEYGANTLFSVSDLLDDGATHSGIYCQMNNGGSYNSLGASLPNSADIGNLLDQYYRTYYSPNALQFFGVPAGTYNVVLYAGNGASSNGSVNQGSTFVVYDALNGNQTGSTADTTAGEQGLAEGVNFVVFTGVHISGQLNVDVDANAALGDTADISGAQLQLVSYDTPAPSVPLNSAVSGSNLTLTWSQGLLQSSTNLLGPWTFIYEPSPVTVPITHTNSAQYFRVQVQ